MKKLKIVFVAMMLCLTTLLISSPNSDIDRAYAEYQKAFEHYTSLALSAQKGDREQALAEYRSKYAEYKRLTQAQDKYPTQQSSADQKPLDTTGVEGIVDIDPSDVENNIAYIEGLRSRTKEEAQTQKGVSGELKQQTDGCKSKEFNDLQLSATHYFDEGKSKMALEYLKRAYDICPTDELKETISLMTEINNEGN